MKVDMWVRWKAVRSVEQWNLRSVMNLAGRLVLYLVAQWVGCLVLMMVVVWVG